MKERGLGGTKIQGTKIQLGGKRPNRTGWGQVFTKVKTLTLNENPNPAHSPGDPTLGVNETKTLSNHEVGPFLLRQPSRREVLRNKETNVLRCLVGRPNVPAVPEPQVPNGHEWHWNPRTTKTREREGVNGSVGDVS